MALRDRVQRLERVRALEPSGDGYRADEYEDEAEAREWFDAFIEEHLPGATLEQQREFLNLVTKCQPGDPVPLPEGYEYPGDHYADP